MNGGGRAPQMGQAGRCRRAGSPSSGRWSRTRVRRAMAMTGRSEQLVGRDSGCSARWPRPALPPRCGGRAGGSLSPVRRLASCGAAAVRFVHALLARTGRGGAVERCWRTPRHLGANAAPSNRTPGAHTGCAHRVRTPYAPDVRACRKLPLKSLEVLQCAGVVSGAWPGGGSEAPEPRGAGASGELVVRSVTRDERDDGPSPRR